MPETVASSLATRVPRLAELMGTTMVEARWDGLAAVYLWQIERDLELLTRHVGWSRVAQAYRASLRNPEELWGVAYELRTAAKLAPVVGRLDLRPRVAAGACDLAVQLGGRRVFLEVTTRDDVYPWRRGDGVEDPPMQARETVHRDFRTTTPDQVVPTTRDRPGSEDLREAIRREVRQLPRGELTVVVLGTPKSHFLEVEDAVFGDERLGGTARRMMRERVANGLFTLSDEELGVSRVSALVWMKLRHHWHDLRAHGRLFLNPNARAPFPPEIEAVFRRAFDPSAVLAKELQRIKRILVEQYRAERVILFGSLATDVPADAVHDASDLDLAVVKPTKSRFVDRVREALDLVEPRVGLNPLVYTPEEIARAEAAGPSFIRDEILVKGKGKTLFPADG